MLLQDIKSRHDISNFLNQNDLIGLGVEIGVLRGDFSKSILSNWKGQKLFLIDAWRHIGSNVDLNNGDHIIQLSNIVETFKSVYEFKERATIIRDTSLEASKLFSDNSLDFVYIDAAHDYTNVSKDLDTWLPKVRKGGLICGDDYIDGVMLHNGVTVFEVKRAVDDFAAKHQLTVVSSSFEGEFPQWWCIK